MTRRIPFVTTRRIPFVSAFVLLLVHAVNACNCGPEVVGGIAPQIYLNVCKDPQREIGGELIGGFRDCAHDFGTRDISVKVPLSIRVTNPSRVELTLKNVEIVGDPAFKLELAPTVIQGGFAGDIVVSVRPRVEAPIEATLFILSDANNTEQTPEGDSLIEVKLTANGVDNGIPDIHVEPTECDYGRVAQGGVAVCQVEVTNIGLRGLVLDEVAFIPPVDEDGATLFQVPSGSVRSGGTDGVCDITTEECAFAFTGRPPEDDEEIAPNATATLSVRFTPDVLGNFQGKFRILSNDPDEERIDVTLSGISVTPPVCAIRIKSVNGQPVPPGVDPEIQPLDNVVLSLDESSPATPDGSIDRYEWQQPPQRPAGSTVLLATPTSVDTGFTFQGESGVDLAGRYTVRAIVFDDLGTASVNECSLSFEAIPKDHFLVQLTWDTADNDFDLHIVQEDPDAPASSDFCIDATSGDTPTGLYTDDCDNDLDCNFASCTPGDVRPEWDGVVGDSAGDPSLDRDDIDGFGPENTNVDAMVPGRYLIGVNEYLATSSFEATASIRIFVFGRLKAEFFRLMYPGDWWEVALVEWPEDIVNDCVCIEDLTDGDPDDDIAACHARPECAD